MLNETRESKKSLEVKTQNHLFQVGLVFKMDLFIPNPKLILDLKKLDNIIKKENF